MADIERLLVVGSGGREFALIQEAQSFGIPHVYSTRGEDAVNYGIEGVVNTGLGEKGEKSIRDIGSFASQQGVDLVIVGPEAPLIEGLADNLRSRGIPTYGPGADGAGFERDKTITDRFVRKYGLPNPPNSAVFASAQREAAQDYIRRLGAENIYTKRVGQEGGKGAVGYGVDELEKALREVDAVADKGERLLIQGRLLGLEYSAMFMLDGRGNAVATALSRDHKSLYDGGLGLNTGGMGAFAPISLADTTVQRRKEIEGIGWKMAEGLLREGIDYRGTLYAGLRADTLDPASLLRVLENNIRFGDPELQVLLQSLGGRAIAYMYAAARGAGSSDMSRLYLDADNEPVSLTVCLASPGYSEEGKEPLSGLPIHVPDDLPDDISLQYAGAKIVDGVPVSSGGRVLYITKTAKTLIEARTVYNLIGRENGGVYLGDDQQVIRTDIGAV